MDREQSDMALGQALPVANEEWLLRLHFSPEHLLGDGGLRKLRALLLNELQTLIALDQYITDRRTAN
jgi:hypothetical protein